MSEAFHWVAKQVLYIWAVVFWLGNLNNRNMRVVFIDTLSLEMLVLRKIKPFIQKRNIVPSSKHNPEKWLPDVAFRHVFRHKIHKHAIKILNTIYILSLQPYIITVVNLSIRICSCRLRLLFLMFKCSRWLVRMVGKIIILVYKLIK